MLTAQDFAFHVPKGDVPSRIELSVLYPVGAGSVKTDVGAMPASVRVGDWEVTVAFDVQHCEISCVYRRIRDVTHLLPPVAEIRLYGGTESTPATIVCDPAGLRLPFATSRVLVVSEAPGIPARRLFTAVLIQDVVDRPPLTGASVASSFHTPQVSLPATVPLRI